MCDFLFYNLVKDLCDPNPCANRGICTSNGASFHCQCPIGFAGEICKGGQYKLNIKCQFENQQLATEKRLSKFQI